MNERLADPERFVTIAHELAHIFCGHLGGSVSHGSKGQDESGWPDRRGLGKHEREIEAEATPTSRPVLDWLPDQLLTSLPMCEVRICRRSASKRWFGPRLASSVSVKFDTALWSSGNLGRHKRRFLTVIPRRLPKQAFTCHSAPLESGLCTSSQAITTRPIVIGTCGTLITSFCKRAHLAPPREVVQIAAALGRSFSASTNQRRCRAATKHRRIGSSRSTCAGQT